MEEQKNEMNQGAKGNRPSQQMNAMELKMSVFYVLIFFAVTTLACCLIIFFADASQASTNRKKQAIEKMDRVKEFRKAQDDCAVDMDSICNKVLNYHPSMIAQYEENDINTLKNDLQNVYESNRHDHRYKAFLHAADFYGMWLTDRKTLWGKLQNIEKFKADLQECEAGIQKVQDQVRMNN